MQRNEEFQVISVKIILIKKLIYKEENSDDRKLRDTKENYVLI